MRERTLCRREMRRELMRVYREVVADCPQGTSQTEVYEKVVKHPAPRFYVDPRMAHLVISPMMRGDNSPLEKMGALKRQMYHDLYDVVMRLTQVKRFWHKSIYYILKEAVLEPAPRFYISADRMRMIWKEEVVETRQQKYKRIGRPYGENKD
jgi:hypothetical protein